MSATSMPDSKEADVAPSGPLDLSQNRKVEKNTSARSVFTSIMELDHLREVARGASMEFVQLGSGVLHGLIARVDLGLSGVHVNVFSLPHRAQGVVGANELTILVPDNRNQGVINGERLTPDKVLLFRPGAEVEGASPAAFQHWPITVDPAELRRFVFDLSGREMELPRASCTALQPSRVVVERLRAFATTVLGIAANTPQALDDGRVRKTLCDELMARVAAIVTDQQRSSAPEPRSFSSRGAIVRRAERFILAHLTESISIAEICAFADVSERSLQLAFHQVMGIGPNAYLKVRRLHRVRADLERADPRVTSVSMVALRWGFWHFGHFTHDYVALFGEKPSHTLRRQCPHAS